jgi:acyl dehydratase
MSTRHASPKSAHSYRHSRIAFCSLAENAPTDFAAPVMDRYFEDYVPGTVGVYGRIAMTEAEIVEFARRYDPQSIHTDPEAAARGPFEGLIASGWHTIACVMRVLVEHYLSHVAAIVSPGIDELRWKAPVRPGDVLRVRITVEEASPSRTKPDRGLVRTFIEAVNDRDEVVLTMRAMNIFRRRETGSSGASGGEGSRAP